MIGSPVPATAAATDRSAAPVVIVGGGVVGLCCARSLARRGVPVTVLERDEIGHGASFGNAGTISPGHPPINAPGRWRELIRSIVDPASPLYIAPRVDPALWRWMLAFARNCGLDHVRHCRDVLAPLAAVTPGLHDEIAETAAGAGWGDELGYRRDGYLEIYRSRGGAEVARDEAAFATAQGFAPEPIDGDALREREPALSGEVRGGYRYPEGRWLDPYTFVRALADEAEAHGARVESGVEVRSVRTQGDRAVGVTTAAGEVDASAVVLATGAYSPDLYRRLGCPLPIAPAKGYHSDLAAGSSATPALSTACLLVETSVFCTPLPGRLRLAGTLEFSGINHEMRPRRLRQLGLGARPFLGDLAEAPETVSEWCGLRPCTPDGLPAVGALPGWRGVYAATGHAMLGLTFGPVTGELVADLVVDGRASMPIEALSPARFGSSRR